MHTWELKDQYRRLQKYIGSEDKLDCQKCIRIIDQRIADVADCYELQEILKRYERIHDAIVPKGLHLTI